jgi:hypothetical protein
MPKPTIHQEHAARCDAERQAERFERNADLDIKAARLLEAGRAHVTIDTEAALGYLYGRAMRARYTAHDLKATGWWYRDRFNESATQPKPKSNGADNTGHSKYSRNDQIS